MSAIAAIIVAGGTGSRMGEGLPKPYRQLNGMPILQHTLAAFAQHPKINEIIIVHHPDHADYLAPILANFQNIKTVEGGTTRQDSVRNGLEALANMKKGGQQADPAMSPRSGSPSSSPVGRTGAINKVLIHDAARPFVSQELISRMIDVDELAAIPVVPVTNTIKHKEGHTLDRSELFAAQTPQAFDFQTILKLHHEASEEVTDDAMLAEQASIKVAFIEGDKNNIKITTEEDLPIMTNIRVGNGFDVHAFIPHEGGNKTIKICGVSVECEMAIEGHSDGDVGLHALTDAILGTIGAGDIGHHFSPDNPQWKDADSAMFLAEALRLLKEQGGSINHVDVTIIAQMPKLAPHREAMRTRIAEIVEIDVKNVSVKATTTDGLGFTGRKEGLAAQATATVILS